MYGDGFAKLGEAVAWLIGVLSIVVVISLPLAIWKAVDLVVWFFSHVRWE